MNEKKWSLEGYDTFEGGSDAFYLLDGTYDDEPAAQRAAKLQLEKLEKSQPTGSSGGQKGIQDHVYIVRPDGSKYRFDGTQCIAQRKSPGSKWIEAIHQTPRTNRDNLVWKRPIIVWVSKKKKAIRRLIKISSTCGADQWMIQGRDEELGQDIDVTVSPKTLEKILDRLTPENGWVVYEFEDEIEFYTWALQYLQEK